MTSLNDQLKADRERQAAEDTALRQNLDVIREKVINIATDGLPEGQRKADVWNLVGALVDVAGQIVVDLHRRLNR